MLIKIGTSWVDPLRVEAVRVLYEDTEKVRVRMASGGYETGEVRTFYSFENSPTSKAVGCNIVTIEAQVDVRGVTPDEAAQAINRCREQEMSRTRGVIR